MTLFSFLQRRRTATPTRRAEPPPLRKRTILRLEQLEDRIVPSGTDYFHVTNTDDSAGKLGSLRYELAQANADTSASTVVIDFKLRAGKNTITLTQGQLELSNTHAKMEIEGGGNVTVSGGGNSRVFQVDNGVTAEMDDLKITGGYSTGQGGGILNHGDLTIENCIISGNSSSFGGGITNAGGTVSISDSTLSDNTANLNGGAIYNPNGSTVNIRDSTLSGNKAIIQGGGVSNSGHAATVNISGSTFSGNSTGTVYNGTNSLGFGGGIGNNAGTVNIRDSIFSGNKSIEQGGGINNSHAGTANISDSIFSDNKATNWGGGINNAHGSTVNISDSTFSGNKATYWGGGIADSGSGSANIRDSTFSGNTAGDEGGGIYNSGRGTVNIDNSTVAGNTATNDGGGIYNDSSSTVNIAQSTIANNWARDYGGGICNTSSSTVKLANSIVAQNQAPTDPDVFGDFISQGHNLIGDVGNATGFNNGVNGDIVGTAAHTVNARLGWLAYYGGPTMTIALLPGSPAINAGSNALVPNDPNTRLPFTTDQRGSPRIVGGTVDIGAYEVQVPAWPFRFWF